MYNHNSNDNMQIKEERPYLANELRATLTDVLVMLKVTDAKPMLDARKAVI